MDEVEVNLENGHTVTLASGPKFTGKKDGVSTVVAKQNSKLEVSEKQNIGASGETELGSKDNRYASTGFVEKGWKKKKDKPVRSGKRAKSGLEKSKRKKKHKQDNVFSSINAAAHEEPNDQLQSFNNGNFPRINVVAESNLLHFLSELPQGNEVSKTTSSIPYPIEGSSLAYMVDGTIAFYGGL